MDTLALIVLYWAIFFVTTFITWVLYIKEPVKIEPWSYFDRLPWNCWKCCTTWVMAATYISVAYILGNIAFGVWGCILTAGNALAMEITERRRFNDD